MKQIFLGSQKPKKKSRHSNSITLSSNIMLIRFLDKFDFKDLHRV